MNFKDWDKDMKFWYFVVNVDEGELGICKDCEIMCKDFYKFVEGCFVVG